MKLRISAFCLLLSPTLFLGTGTAPTSADAKSISFFGFGSYQRYRMSDVNQVMNQTLASFPGARADKDKLTNGGGFGAGMRIWPAERTFVSLEFQRLLASNSGTGSYAGSNYAVEGDVPASSVTTTVGYVLTPRSRFRVGLAAGGGYYMTTGSLTIIGPGVNEHFDLEGSGFGAHGFGFVLAGIGRNVGVEVDAGYRYAKTTDVTVDGSRYRNADGSLSKIDWSGFMSRAGLTFTVPGK
jgi:hypothetical protein